MKKLVIAAGGIMIVLVAGIYLYRHFVINSIMDGPFMENITPDESEAEPEQRQRGRRSRRSRGRFRKQQLSWSFLGIRAR